MIIISDSGSTKTQWRVVESNGSTSDFTSQGLNPYFLASDEYISTIRSTFPADFSFDKVEKIIFYGSGCARAERASEVADRLKLVFVNSTIEVHSDILGAARALFGKSNGIVIILGSGTNVGYYDGETVEHETPSLGYVIGDEGSGAYLGKKLLRHWLYNNLPKDLEKEMNERYKLTISEVLYRVYNQPFPNRFLAEFVPFFVEHSEHQFVKDLVRTSFTKLVQRHLVKYHVFNSVTIGAIGSVAVVFQEVLKDVISEHGGNLDKVIQYPIENLTHFHSIF